ncbi:MAG: 2,3-bisphosphoglycerate-dependent phosphoglycerate mutase, partial [Ancrocorticia sp.]|nr:2,3-bisphosphoglycerate-dependent phosphoglycerate mutase [Ancrocorticia sp.]
RSYDVPPPAIEAGSEYSQDTDPRYAGEPIPMTECLKDVLERLMPYWNDVIVPDIKTGKTIMIAAHGNSLRAIVKYLDDISDDEIAGVNIPTGIPLVYELDEETLKPIKKGGKYLDPEAEAKIAAVANQGK